MRASLEKRTTLLEPATPGVGAFACALAAVTHARLVCD
jgi:hypothetical protein